MIGRWRRLKTGDGRGSQGREEGNRVRRRGKGLAGESIDVALWKRLWKIAGCSGSSGHSIKAADVALEEAIEHYAQDIGS